MYNMGKQLYEHEKMLTEIREGKLSCSTVSGSGSEHNSTNSAFSLDTSRMVRQELDFESQKTQTKIMAVMEELRREFSDRYTRRDDFTMMIYNQIVTDENIHHHREGNVAKLLRWPA